MVWFADAQASQALERIEARLAEMETPLGRRLSHEVTRRQIELLSQRIQALAPAKVPEYRVFMRFTGETDEEFLARYPDQRGADGKRKPDDPSTILLSFNGID